MILSKIPSGSALFERGKGGISVPIGGVQGSDLTHVAMMVDGEVFEMTWPKLRHMPAEAWLAQATDPVVAPILLQLTGKQVSQLETWWMARIGMAYQWPLLLALAPVTYWQRLTRTWTWLPVSWRHIQPIGGDEGVCSSNYAWALEAAGIAVPETTGATPADIATWSEILGPLEFIEPIAALKRAA